MTISSAHQYSSTDHVTFAIQVITDLAMKLGIYRGLIQVKYVHYDEHRVLLIRNPDHKLNLATGNGQTEFYHREGTIG